MKLILACVLVLVASVAQAQTPSWLQPLLVTPPRIVVPTAPVAPSVPQLVPAGPPAIIAADGTYLGRLSTNRLDLQSTANPYGPFGSRYSPTSINNPYSMYGSPYSTLSPTNPYATTPPVLVAPSPIVPWYLR